MRLVHSLMTDQLRIDNWIEPSSFFRSFALSFILAQKNGGPVDLVTDLKGKHLLVDVLGLPYDRVSLELDSLAGKYPQELWPLGKIKAYQVQTEPFIHIDGDLFILKPLPDSVYRKPITFQSMEGAELDYNPGCYKIDRFLNQGAKLPSSWLWCLKSSRLRQYAVNMGFYACNQLSINRQYCQEAFDFVDDPANQIFLGSYPALWELGVSIEQFTASAVCRMNGVVPNYLTREYTASDWNASFLHLFWKQKLEIRHEEMIKKLLTELAPEYLDRAEVAARYFTNYS